MTPDGKLLVVMESNVTGGDLTLVHLDGTARTEPLIQTSFEELNAEISPDGRWLAYQSNELGQSEVYVRPFPNVDGGRWQVSTGGGQHPLWARNGRELFYVAERQRALVSVTVQAGSSFSTGNPAKVLDTPPYLTTAAGRSYEVSTDGRRFLMIKNPTASGSAPQTAATMTVVLNWLEELKARVPAK